MPPLFLKAQQAVHPLLFVTLPLVRPQPQPPNLATQLQSSLWPWVSPCLPQLCGSSHGSSIPRSGPSPNPPPARACLMKAGRPVPIKQGASLNRERRGLPRALWLALGPELAEQPHGAVPAAGHGQPGVAPANRGSAGVSIAQRAPQAEAPGQQCFAAMPGALPATSAPGNVAGTGVGWSPNPAPPRAAWQPRSILTVLPAASPLHWHWRGACRGAGSPKPESLPLHSVSQLPPRIPGPAKESTAPGT